MRRSVILYVFLFIFLASLIGGSVFSTYKFFMEEGPLPVRKEVFIEKGYSSIDVSVTSNDISLAICIIK